MVYVLAWLDFAKGEGDPNVFILDLLFTISRAFSFKLGFLILLQFMKFPVVFSKNCTNHYNRPVLDTYHKLDRHLDAFLS